MYIGRKVKLGFLAAHVCKKNYLYEGKIRLKIEHFLVKINQVLVNQVLAGTFTL